MVTRPETPLKAASGQDTWPRSPETRRAVLHMLPGNLSSFFPMKKSYHRILLAVFLLGVGWLVWSWLHSVDPVALSPSDRKPVQEKSTTQPDGGGITAKVLRAIESDLNSEIAFYGEVVDQDEQPLSSVTVSFSVWQERVGASGAQRYQTVTDGGGRFTIEGKKGASLTLEKFEKEGYRQIVNEGNVFSYAGASQLHQPDPAKPMRFSLAQKGLGGDVVEWSSQLKFKWDGTAQRYDLTTGKPSNAGELEIVPRRKRYVELQPRDFDWSVDITMPGGGIVVVDPRRGRVAPSGGYKETLTLGRGYSDRANLLAVTSVHLCAKSANGTYALLELAVYPDRRETANFAGSLSGSWNPTGSRVLLKEIVPPR